MEPVRIAVSSATRNYEVVCGSGILRQPLNEIAALGAFSSIHLVSSPRVWRALRKRLNSDFAVSNSRSVHFMNDAESAKNLQTVEKLSRSLIKSGADRKSLLIAIGGGVVGDVAGFVAATYLRGIVLVHVPTTVVAQVDSSIGGKTGVNLPEGKNLIGAFYPPSLVLTDPETLRTLPEREFRGGLAEMIKHAVIADANMFVCLEKSMERLTRREPSLLCELIPRNVAIKAGVVSRDEREAGLREVLNFGHTFAHALESLTRYARYQHGEAVAWGMMCAALLGHEIGITKADEVSRIVSLVRRMGPLPPWPNKPTKAFIRAMTSDKKSRAGKLRFVLTPGIGQAGSYDDVPLAAVERVLRFAPHFFCEPHCPDPGHRKLRKPHA